MKSYATGGSFRWTDVRTERSASGLGMRSAVGGQHAGGGHHQLPGQIPLRMGHFLTPSETLHLVERFTRVDPDTIEYKITVEDPAIFTRPWTA